MSGPIRWWEPFGVVVRFALAYRDADAEDDRAWLDVRAELAAALVRWHHRIAPGTPVRVAAGGPGWEEVAEAVIALDDGWPPRRLGRTRAVQSIDGTYQPGLYRLRRAGATWAQSVPFTVGLVARAVAA